eukprot:TRINITY_DN11046_c0_g1_i3.p1 TRINITY_DN11046_c0_g1~~TRINITY_DN11046_c0_g1_i3.p1  ORF type:complete len:525 (-),score=87.44 TRINITY_DN11046_c0_g1_i3:401-1741(-)
MAALRERRSDRRRGSSRAGGARRVRLPPIEGSQSPQSECSSGSDIAIVRKSNRFKTWSTTHMVAQAKMEVGAQDDINVHAKLERRRERRKTLPPIPPMTDKDPLLDNVGARPDDDKQLPVLLGREPGRKKSLKGGYAKVPDIAVPPGTTQSCASTTTPHSDGFNSGLSTPESTRQIVNWVLGKRIGHGAQGTVHKALNKDTGTVFAVKVAYVNENCEADRKFHDKIAGELAILSHICHPNVVSLLGHENSSKDFFIFMEYVPGGSLQCFYQEFGAVEEPCLSKASRGLIEGLDYLHNCNPPVVHRDIKGANVLVSDSFVVKLADFGCSKSAECTKSFTTMGSIPWMAPEVIMHMDGYGRKADIWSLGCTIVEMASAAVPWGALMEKNVMFAMKHIAMSEEMPPLPEAMPEACRELVTMCLRRTPEERSWCSELRELDFVRHVDVDL